MGNLNTEAYERRLRARLVRRAIETDAPLLASALNRYAVGEGLTWADLADSLGCSVDALHQVAICRAPRPESFVADVEAIAGEYVDPDRLLPLLRRLQVLSALGKRGLQTALQETSATDSALLLAARDREEEADRPTVELPPDTPEDGHE